MLLNVLEAIRRTHLTELEYFNCAYYSCYGKYHDCSKDVAEFKLHQTVPVYVQIFAKNSYDGSSK